MIFNKSGRKIKHSSFLFDSIEIESVNSYSYLGFNVSSSGKFHGGIDRLLNKAQRAWFSILRFLNKSRNRKIDTYFTLFDSIVKPILLYACEIWGYIEDKNDLSSIGRSYIERFHLKVCKQILGVHRKTSNIATLLELGRYPLKFDIRKSIIKYFLRFKSLDKNRLVYKAYEEELSNMNYSKNWITYTKYTLDNNGLSYIFQDNLKFKQSSDQNIEKLSKILMKGIKTYLNKLLYILFISVGITTRGN